MVISKEGNFIDSKAFDLHESSVADDDLGAFLAGLPDHVIVLIAVADEATFGNDAAESDKQGADQQLIGLGATNPRPLGWRASWALVGYKGTHDGLDWLRFSEALGGQGPTEISVVIPKPLHTYSCA